MWLDAPPVCGDRYIILTNLQRATGSTPNVSSHVSTSVAIAPILFDWLSRDGGSQSNMIGATMTFKLSRSMTRQEWELVGLLMHLKKGKITCLSNFKKMRMSIVDKILHYCIHTTNGRYRIINKS